MARFETGYFFTSTAAYVPRVTGLASVFSSFLIMYLILSSRSKLKTTYHRIMFLMSLCDAAASVAMSLTTMPMPRDVRSVYPFETGSFGNTTTCEIQGFVYQFGTLLVIFLNLMLHFYFLCMIRYNVSKPFFARYLEPLLLFISVVLSLISPVLSLKYDRMNPTVYGPFCDSAPYPWTCTVEEDVTCIRGGNAPDTVIGILKWYFLSVITIGFVVIITFMILIVLKVYRAGGTEFRCIRGQSPGDVNAHQEPPSPVEIASLTQQTNVISCQAVMYVSAFILTYLFTVLSFVADVNAIHFLKLVFQPMQGLFNALIFVYDKVQSLRRDDENLTFCESLRILILQPREAPEMFVSSLEIIDGRRGSDAASNEDQQQPRGEVAEPRTRLRRSGRNLMELERQFPPVRNQDQENEMDPITEDEERISDLDPREGLIAEKNDRIGNNSGQEGQEGR